jgi:prepilin peptidase CpaA
MPELDNKTILFLVSVVVFTLVAAVCDFRTRKIPNKLTVPFFVLGLLFHVVFYGWAGPETRGVFEVGLRSALSGFAIGFGTLLALWLIGGGGGGDVKLMGALSVWLGFTLTLYVMIVSTLFVMFGTLTMMAWNLIQRGPWSTKKRYIGSDKPTATGSKPKETTTEDRQKRRIMAYAIPVALATWTVLVWTIMKQQTA